MLTVNSENVSRSKRIALEIDRFAMLVGSVPSSECAGDVEALLSLSNHIRERLFDVLFIGRLRSGKSTLVNALAGKQLEATKTIINLTTVITRFSFGEDRNTVYVYYRGEEKPREMTLAEFTEEFHFTFDELDALECGEKVNKFANVLYAETYSDDEVFADGIDLIDSPGLEYAGATIEIPPQSAMVLK